MKRKYRCNQLWNVKLEVPSELSNPAFIIFTKSAPVAISKAKKKYGGRITLVSAIEGGTIDSF